MVPLLRSGVAVRIAFPEIGVMQSSELLKLTERALGAAEAVLRAARATVNALVAPGGAVEPALIDREQIAVHGVAWMATYVEALRQSRQWALRLDEAGEFGEARR